MGSSFGRYSLLDLLGRGGMGEVWRAHDSATDRVVAVKVLTKQFADDEEFQERFHREARAAAGLNDPHVVPIHGYGEVDGRLYVEMRLIEGRGLDEVIGAGPLYPERAVGIVEQVASALDAAHRVGLVHRDVKPSNILLTGDDFAYLIDFGIARVVGDVGLTQTGAAIGSWAYMAPERIRSNAVDARSDVYALTCVLHECLTGARPFAGGSFEELAAAHLWVPPPVPSRGAGSVPAGFDAVIAAGMAKELTDRYGGVRELARASRAALNPLGQPTAVIMKPVGVTPVSGFPDGTELADAKFGDLPDVITASVDGPRSFEWPPVDDPDRAPYRGWQPFEPVDAGIFFGRDVQIARAVDVVARMRAARSASWLVVLGPSGSGKSAFLRAGLVPRLQREDGQYLVLPIVRPERDAVDGVSGFAASVHGARQALSLAGPTLGDIKGWCVDHPQRVRGLLIEVAQAAAAARSAAHGSDTRGSATEVSGAHGPGGVPTLVLPVDQCEELLAADAGPQGEAFLRLVAELTNPSGGERLDLIVVATIRTDRFEALQTHPVLADAELELFGELKPMPREQFREVILGPATAAADVKKQVAVTSGLVERLLADCREGGDTLPLLSLTLARLYQDYGATSKVLTVAQYEQMGGLQKVVRSEIDAVLSGEGWQRDQQLAALRSAFVPWLATISPDTDQPLRRVARYNDLPPNSRPLVDALVGRRLLVKDLRDGQVVVEVALESLLRQWDELAGWLREERANLKTADEVERSAGTWESSGRDAAWLLTGSRLVEAEVLVRTPGFFQRLTPTADFINTSRHAEDIRIADLEQRRDQELRIAWERQATAETHATTLNKRSRVLRAVLAVAVVVALVAAGLGVFSYTQRQTALRERNAAIALRLNTEAQGILAGSHPGGDRLAFDKLLAARTLAPPDDGALLHAVAERTTTRRIIDVSTVGTDVLGAAALSPDGHRFATARSDNAVQLWDADTGQASGDPLMGHAGTVTSVAFSPDGHRLATGSADNTLRLWDVDTGQSVGEPRTSQGRVFSVAFSPDGTKLASAGADGTVRLWDVNTGRPLGEPLVGHTDIVWSAAFSPDGHLLATASSDKSVRLWNTDTGQPLGEPLIGHTDQVRSVAFSPDGRRLASAGTDKTVRLWNIDTGQPQGEPLIGHTSDVFSVAFSPDGRRLASASADTTVRLWNADTGQPQGEPLTGHTHNVFAVAFSPDGHQLASASDDHTVRLWNADKSLTGNSEITDVAFSPDGRRIATANDNDHTVRLWDVDTGQPVGALLAGHTQAVYGVSFSPDGRRIASGSSDGTVRLWDADTGQPIGQPLVGHVESVWSVAFSPDGLVIASGGQDRTVRLWDAGTGQPIGEPLTGHTGQVLDVAFSPGGHLIASGSQDRTVRLWDVDTGEPVGEPLTGHIDEVISVSFSPDGHRLASASSDNTVRLWDVDGRRLIGDPLTGHTGTARGAVFSPDGHRLATASDDGTARLWDADGSQPLGEPLTGQAGQIYAVAFSPDGHRIATGGQGGTVRLWDVDASPKVLCDKMVANISHDQWKLEISPDIPYVALCPDLPVASD